MTTPFCEATSKSTGERCQQPERWLMQAPREWRRFPEGQPLRVCQVHGRMLERQGWTFEREIHPVAGFERVEVPS